MISLVLPVRGRIVSVEVPDEASSDLKTTIVRTIIVEAAFMARVKKRIQRPQLWARAVAGHMIEDSHDPVTWQRRLVDLDRWIDTAKDFDDDYSRLTPEEFCARVLFRRLEDGRRLSDDADRKALRRSAMLMMGHQFCRLDECAICRGLAGYEDPYPLLEANSADGILLRIFHDQMVQAEVLPPFIPAWLRSTAPDIDSDEL
jgi:hypothetical protein